ncbi:M15 family metallopeptidase [Phenylobacterium sp.]|jgi:hypothetical protein|uniref:M15 family metallopeptidase n=1 Tax=Phenylobacterium sp. TaxID=1871053 RepID=UPI002F91CE33
MKKWLALLVVLLVVGLLATRDLWRRPADSPRERASAAAPAAAPAVPCPQPARLAEAARANGAALKDLDWAPFGPPEQGWDVYEPVIAADIGTTCGGGTPGFAAALEAWQAKNGLPATGRIEPATFEKMRVIWMLRRPFVRQTRDGSCPPGASEAALQPAERDEGYWRKQVHLAPQALAAYRRMREAARREVPGAGSDRNFLVLVSGFRAPDAVYVRGGAARAGCSAHRTGTALDLYVGALPGSDPTSTADANRSWQAQTPIYRWLTANAGRYGFVGYPYEPWHWEYAGD